MNMKRLYIVLVAVLIIGVLLGVGGNRVFSTRLALQESDNKTVTPEQIQQQLEVFKQLNKSPIAKITRNILDIFL